MKKKYIAPEMKSTRIAIAYTILTGSTEITGNPATVNGDGEYNTLSRGHRRWWDDDDEEEF